MDRKWLLVIGLMGAAFLLSYKYFFVAKPSEPAPELNMAAPVEVQWAPPVAINMQDKTIDPKALPKSTGAENYENRDITPEERKYAVDI